MKKLHLLPLILLSLTVLLHPVSSYRRYPNSDHYFILPPLPSPPSSALAPSPSQLSPSEPPIGQQLEPEPPIPFDTAATTMSLDERPHSLLNFLPGFSSTVTGSSTGACKESTYPGICASAVKQFFTSGFTGSFDTSTTLDLLMKVGKKQTEVALMEFNRIANSHRTPVDVKATLDGCKQDYSDALDAFDSAMEALKVNDMPTVKINLDAVLQGYYGCGEGDAPGNPEPSASGPWTRFNDELRKLTDNCFDLVDTLKTSSTAVLIG